MGKKFKIIYFLFSILIAIVLINTILFIRSKNRITFTDKYCGCLNLGLESYSDDDIIDWSVTILIKTSDKVINYRPICFGIVLNQKTILTSATCFRSLSQKELSNIFITSNHNLNQINESNYRKIVKIYFNPDFNSLNQFRSFYDQALVRLNKEFEFIDNQSKIRPACLIDKKLDYYRDRFLIGNFGDKNLLPSNRIAKFKENNLTDYKFEITYVHNIDCSNFITKFVEKNSSFVEQFKLSSICLKSSISSIDSIGTTIQYRYYDKFFVIGIINNHLVEQLRKDDNYFKNLNKSIGFFTLFDEQHFDWIQQLIGDNMCTDPDKTNRKEFNHFILLTGVSYFLVSCLIIFVLTVYLPPSKKNSTDKNANYLNSDLKNLDDISKNLNNDKFNSSGRSMIKSKKSEIKNSIGNDLELKILTKNEKIDKIDDKIDKRVDDNKNMKSKEGVEELKNNKNELLNNDLTNNNEINNNQQLNKDTSIDRIKKVKFNE